MAKINQKASTKSARKQACAQRGIGNMSAKQLQDAVAAIKAKTTTKHLHAVSVPKPAEAAGDKDSSSIPDCVSDCYSSDVKLQTPELVPASPTSLSIGSFETDGAASSACSTSDDEGLVPLKAVSGHEYIIQDLYQVLRDQQTEEALNHSSTALEPIELTLTCPDMVTDHQSVEIPSHIFNNLTWELSSEAQACAEAEERFSGAWTFEFSSDMALNKAGLAQFLPVPAAREDDAIIRASDCMLALCPVSTQVAAADGTDVTSPSPDLGVPEAQEFAKADERCSGPDLWTCDFVTVTVVADMTQLRPQPTSEAADPSDQVSVSPLVAYHVHAATAAEEDTAELLAQHLMTARRAAPSSSWPAALALHACSHLQAASAHRWLQPRRFACIRLPLQLFAAAGIEAMAITAAVCRCAMALA